MSGDHTRQERRSVLLLVLAIVGLVLAGVLAAAVLSADAPRRGEGMIPPPADEPASGAGEAGAEQGGTTLLGRAG